MTKYVITTTASLFCVAALVSCNQGNSHFVYDLDTFMLKIEPDQPQDINLPDKDGDGNYNPQVIATPIVPTPAPEPEHTPVATPKPLACTIPSALTVVKVNSIGKITAEMIGPESRGLFIVPDESGTAASIVKKIHVDLSGLPQRDFSVITRNVGTAEFSVEVEAGHLQELCAMAAWPRRNSVIARAGSSIATMKVISAASESAFCAAGAEVGRILYDLGGSKQCLSGPEGVMMSGRDGGKDNLLLQDGTACPGE